MLSLVTYILNRLIIVNMYLEPPIPTWKFLCYLTSLLNFQGQIFEKRSCMFLSPAVFSMATYQLHLQVDFGSASLSLHLHVSHWA